jgi:hypothetical protein
VDPGLRAIVQAYEYEDWLRGRLVFDRLRGLFILYADRKLMTPATIARIETHFHLPAERTGWRARPRAKRRDIAGIRTAPS